ALLGSIKDDILPLDEIAIYGIRYLQSKYPERLNERYDMQVSPEMSPIEIMDEIGRRRGCLLSGGVIDYDRVINLFLYDIRNSKLGKLTLETADESDI
ncbi:MAG TPA: ribosome biogenesis GTPase YlqF, partial [Bacillota bacterium]|nr:ribosome biogenesis GTPase YlqF [Bacillota bacterium]